ncbi:cytosine deaminase [Schaalia vaccimaxillae]|uniref:cytosine deaminase n=1 Tax=Schaalia vaccimaxillae TaxID=183916 RepID=UPI0003B49613|nr:cytosine deaminase [Schaalia vaccimaxillae]
MRILNATLPDREGTWDLSISDGRFTAITPSGEGVSRAVRSPDEAAPGSPLHNEATPKASLDNEAGAAALVDLDEWDARGRLVLPPFVESHIHLDSVLTAGEPKWNMSGTLFEGIQRWAERKELLTVDDVKNRVRRVVRDQAAFGVQYIRTHVDVTDPDLTALRAMLDLRDELADLVTLQIVAFPQEGIHSFPGGRDLMVQAADLGVDAIGAIPHFEFTREYSVDSLNFACELARDRGLLMDVHCDEIDDEASRGLETLATRAYEYGIGELVTASHTTAMHSYNNAYFVRLLRLLQLSGINFVSNPMVNTHLQGRMDTYPKRRGVTRVKELTEAGINVSFGTDDIQDPWNPLGTGNLRDVVLNGLYVTQMMGYGQIQDSWKFVTTNAARTLHLTDYGIEVGKAARFVVLDASSWVEALNWNAAVVRSVRDGRVIAQTTPAVREVFWP